MTFVAAIGEGACRSGRAADGSPELVAAETIDSCGEELYRTLDFDQIAGFEERGRVGSAEEEAKVLAGV